MLKQNIPEHLRLVSNYPNLHSRGSPHKSNSLKPQSKNHQGSDISLKGSKLVSKLVSLKYLTS